MTKSEVSITFPKASDVSLDNVKIRKVQCIWYTAQEESSKNMLPFLRANMSIIALNPCSSTIRRAYY